MKQKILVVDDQPSLRILLKDTLELEGYEVIEAETGQQAMDKVWNEHPSLVLIDVGLPDITGWEVSKTLMADPRSKEIPIIMVTAGTEGDVKVESVKRGIKHYITKPYDPFAAIEYIKEVLATK